MMGKERSVTSIAASVEVLRRQFGLGRPDSLEALTEQWAELAGEQVAARSRPADLRQGTLTVDAYDPATAEILNWSKQRLLEGARERCPRERITDITVRVRRADRPSGR